MLENVPENSPIGLVQAYDPDDGLNAAITYRLKLVPPAFEGSLRRAQTQAAFSGLITFSSLNPGSGQGARAWA